MISPTDFAQSVREDRRFQRRFWIVQRAGWAVLLAVIAATALGLFGAGGQFATQNIAIANHSVSLPRVMRWDADEDIRFAIGDVAADEIEIGFGAAFARDVEIRTLMPEASASRTSGGTIYYRISTRGPSGVVVFRVRPMRPTSNLQTEISINGVRRQLAIPVLP